MGGSKSKSVHPDVLFMENKCPGAGQTFDRWKKLGFSGQLKTCDILKLQSDLQLEKLKTNKKKKKEKLEREITLSKAWLEESERRDGQRKEREKKKQQKKDEKLVAGLVKEDEETVVSRTREVQRKEEQEVSEGTPNREQQKVEPPCFLTPEQREYYTRLARQRREERERRFNDTENMRKFLEQGGIKKRGAKEKSKEIYPVSAVERHERDFRPGHDMTEEIERCDDCGPTHVTVCPLIEVANPRFGQPTGEQDDRGGPIVDVEPTMLVYRPWSNHDRKKATSGIPHPKDGLNEFINGMQGLRVSYRLNGTELQQCLQDVLTSDWGRVRGDYIGLDTRGSPLTYDSPDMLRQIADLLDRVRLEWPVRVDYAAIGETKQKEGELAAEYRHRLERVFRANSGIQQDEAEESPYQQQLKMHFLKGLLPPLRHHVEKHWVDQNTGSVTQAVNQATHAEGVQKRKQTQSSVYVTENLEAYSHRQNYLRGRGRGRGRGHWRRHYHTRTEDSDQLQKNREQKLCFICHQPGHIARECRHKPPQA
ncbi:uncharacterized protein LOC129348398 [Amphiprion ocellaris]|uniref:uncharacterized protein LOC129348398 n=1 Tax=Amphiprion ocellaris TaxID=80972 RepID=UPI002411238C|nr:uncharacterized protein LOC129348398 [Amphiprion ocellaris]XP_054864723.1 uncharacterized protein LOC129348398 [Amphiprion ocellaris]